MLNGQEYVSNNPGEARKKGISTLFQELNVVDQLTVEENLPWAWKTLPLDF